MLRYLLVLLLVVCGTESSAEYERTRLFTRGYWKVNITYNTDTNRYWCEATTSNRTGQAFSITTYDDGSAIAFVFDNRWSLAKRPIKFLLDIDYSRWTVDGNADDISISVHLNGADKAGKFISELAAGSAVALYNMDKRRLATFSLRGSKAAIINLSDCWDKITNTDPFQTSTDPF